MSKKRYWTSSSGAIEIEMTLEQAKSASHPGDCLEDVICLMECPEIRSQIDAIDPETLVQELLEWGAWEPEELRRHTDNLQRILWLAAGDIADNEADNDREDNDD